MGSEDKEAVLADCAVEMKTTRREQSFRRYVECTTVVDGKLPCGGHPVVNGCIGQGDLGARESAVGLQFYDVLPEYIDSFLCGLCIICHILLTYCSISNKCTAQVELVD